MKPLQEVKAPEAILTAQDGTSTTVEIPAFPNNPELLKSGDRYFVANSPAIGYGTTALYYHEALAYEVPG